MNFELADDQQMMRDMFARFFDEHSSMGRVRAALPSGFDQALWRGIAEIGALSIRVPEAAGGLGLGVFDATILMEEAGRTLASGPLAEALVAAGLLAELGGQESLLAHAIAGKSVVTIALADMAEEPVQWIAGGAVADAVIARNGDAVMLVSIPESARSAEPNLASTPIAELDLGSLTHVTLASGQAARERFAAAIEEWKLLIAAELSGLAREAVRLGSVYACERKQFGQLIGTYQAISHPLADCLSEVESGKLLVWKAIRSVADADAEAGAAISLAFWFNAVTSTRAVAQSLHTFGGYGLTTEYDIHLHNLRAKAWPLIIGDPYLILEEAGRRLYAGDVASLPNVGAMPIDFELGEEADTITDEINAFFDKHVTPEMREHFHYSWEGYDPRIHKKLAESNLLFLAWPKDMGGRGLSPYARSAASEAFELQGYANPSMSVPEMVGAIIHRFGTDELKQDVLAKIVNGDVICSLGYSEPGSGSDVFAAQCRAIPDGDGWRIEGTKMFTSGANLASYVLMLCRTNTEVPKHKGLTMFIVPLDAEGVTVHPVYTFQDERTNITFYDGVKIPDSWRLGDVDGGVKTMSAALELEHSGSMSRPMGAMLRAAEALCRETSRKGQALIDEPRAQALMAKAKADIWASELLAFHGTWAIAEKKQHYPWGSMAKLFSSERFIIDSRDLLDLLAPLSLSKRKSVALVNQSYRHAQGTTIYAGTSEIHRSLIAERALGLPRTRA